MVATPMHERKRPSTAAPFRPKPGEEPAVHQFQGTFTTRTGRPMSAVQLRSSVNRLYHGNTAHENLDDKCVYQPLPGKLANI